MFNLTDIQSGATYLFIITTDGDNGAAPTLLMVKGKDLYTATTCAGQDTSIESGVKSYLEEFGTIEGFDRIKIEVHILKSRPTITLNYRPATQEIAVIEKPKSMVGMSNVVIRKRSRIEPKYGSIAFDDGSGVATRKMGNPGYKPDASEEGD